MDNDDTIGTVHLNDYDSPHGAVDYEIELADCMDVLRRVPDQSVDLVLTDIPYDEVDQPSAGLREFDKGIANTLTFDLEEFVEEVIRVTRGSLYIFCGHEQISDIKRLLRWSRLVSVRACAWQKRNPSPANGEWHWTSAFETCAFARRSGAQFNEHCQPNVWLETSPKKRLHKTEKPQALLRRLIEASSSPGDLVLDPCMGSASTGEAALTLGRRFRGVELDPKTYGVAKSRIRRVTGDAPMLYDGMLERLFNEEADMTARIYRDLYDEAA